MPATPVPTDPALAFEATVDPTVVEEWLRDLGIEPGDRLERDGVVAWDLLLDGRRRFDVRTTLILDPAVACIAWVHYAPPLSDQIRKTYRRLLRWNDTFPFVKFALADDERPILATEIPVRWLDRDELGLALARLVAVCDLLLEESVGMIWSGGRRPSVAERIPRHAGLLDRYRGQLAELTVE